MKVFIVGLFLFSASVSFSQTWIEFIPSEGTEPEISNLISTDSIITFDISLPGIFSTEVDSFWRLEIEKHPKLKESGFPELPFLSYLIAISECDSVIISSAIYDSVIMDNINIYPSPEYIQDTNSGGYSYLNELFSYSDSIYNENAFYPKYKFEINSKGYIREQKCLRLSIMPLHFNPVLGKLLCYTKMHIKIEMINHQGTVNKNTGIFNEVLGNSMINYISNGINASIQTGKGVNYPGSWQWISSLANNSYIDEPCDYLIITHQNFYNNTVTRNAIEELAEHRAHFNGFDVGIIKDSLIYNNVSGYNRTQKIRNLIQNTYDEGVANNTYDGKLAYVNLFGDAYFGNSTDSICIPSYPFNIWQNLQGGEDTYFSKLTYDSTIFDYDVFPDIMLGRCPVDNEDQLLNVVNKILQYAPDTYNYNANILLFVDDDPNLYSSFQIDLNTIKPVIPSDSTFLLLPEDYPYNPPDWSLLSPYSENTLIEKWGMGNIITNYIGHGSQGDLGFFNFQPSSLDSTTNNKLTNFISHACLTGEFHSPNSDCFTENLLINDSLKGCITALAYTSLTPAYAGIFQYNSLYGSIYNNYEYVIGECFFSLKINCQGDDNVNLNQLNLFGDPATNIFHENINGMRPDLCIKESEIFQNQDFYNSDSDTIHITAIINNKSWYNINQNFITSCYAIGNLTLDTIWIGTHLKTELDGYSRDTLEYTWFINDLTPEKYAIYISVDSANSINELVENNNIASVEAFVYPYSHGFPFIANNNSSNSHPVSFNINTAIVGDEIIWGDKIISNNGQLIEQYNFISDKYTSIANLNNNDNYQTIQIQSDTFMIRASGEEGWIFDMPDYYSPLGNPLVFDLDNDGFEEVIVTGFYNDYTTINYCIISLNYDGTIRWNFQFPYTQLALPSVSAFSNDTNNFIILYKYNGTIEFYKEKETKDSLQLLKYIQLQNCNSILLNPLISDIDNDSESELILVYKNSSNIYRISIVNLETNATITKTISSGTYFNLAISDINNSGNEDIILSKENEGILVLENNLDTLIYIADSTLTQSEIVTGDVNNDGYNDIICTTKHGFDYYITCYNFLGNINYSSPVIGKLNKCWVSDSDCDNKIEVIYSYGDLLSIIDFQNSGGSIGYPGQQANIRNTGVLSHPAFYNSNDTVYWYNRILISDSISVPKDATIIIKPNTKIVADQETEMSIAGVISAKGTDDFPIIFDANVNTSTREYWNGITLKNNSNSEFEYCTFRNAKFALLYEDFNNQFLESCVFKNNRIGVGAFNSNPDLKYCYFTENNRGIGSFSNASPRLADTGGEAEYLNALIDNDTNVYMNCASVYLSNGYNDIYRSDHSGYYLYRFTNQPMARINAIYNYWGATSLAHITPRLYPSTSYLVNPFCLSEQTSYKSTNVDPDEQFNLAYN